MKLKFNCEKIKIIHFTDNHLSYPVSRSSLDALKNIVKNEKPDFLVFSGDLFHRYHNEQNSRLLIQTFNEFMDKLGVKYTFCFGNHDAELSLTKKQIFEILMEGAYFVGEIGDEKLSRFHLNDSLYRSLRIGNFIIDVELENGDGCQIILLDSGRYNNQGKSGSITKDQQLLVNEAKKELPLLMFFHIPLEQFETMYEQYRVSGLMREKVSYQTDESGLYDLVSKLNQDVYINCGHDHINDFEIKNGNVHLNMTPGMCIEEYNEVGVRGYRVFEVDKKVETYNKQYYLKD